jgi:protein-disulfide isomerase
MDYECPPCKIKHKYVNALLHKYKNSLRLSVRHFPLDIHRFAKRAAYIAESYRSTKEFTAVHDKLMEIPKIDKVILDKISLIEPSSEVKESVASDIKLGNKIGIKGTPTFLLCCPDQSVYRIGNFRDIEELIK